MKNRSGRNLKNIKVMDRLPRLSGIDEEFGAQTPEPKIVRHAREGFILDWNISLEPGDERIFSYTIKSKLPIVGTLELKPLVAELSNGKRAASNSFSIYAE